MSNEICSECRQDVKPEWTYCPNCGAQGRIKVIRDAVRRFDHKYEPGAYAVCRRCGEEQHP